MRILRAEMLTLAVLAAQLKSVTDCPAKHVGQILGIFQPETVFKWQRELVRRKWIRHAHDQRSRPRTNQAIESL